MAQVGIEVSFNDNDANKKAKDLVKSMGQLSTLVGEVDKKLEGIAQEMSKTADGQKRLSETTQSYNKFLRETNKNFEDGVAGMDNFLAKTEQLRKSTVNYTAQINALGRGLLSYQSIAKKQFIEENKSSVVSAKMARERFEAQVEFNKVAGNAKATIAALKYNDVLNETIKKVREGMSVEEARKRASMEAKGVAIAVLEQQLKLEMRIKRAQQKEVVGDKLQQQRELIALLEKGYTVQQATERLNLRKQGYTLEEIRQHTKLNRLKDEAVARERMEAAIKAANLGVDKQITNLQNIMNVSKTRGLSIAQATLVVNLQEQGVELNKINLLVQQNALMDKMLAKERESLILSQKKVAKPTGGVGLANKETGNSGFLNPSSFAAGGLVGGSLNKFFAGFSAAIIVAEVIKIADTMNLLDARMKLVSRTSDDLVQSKKDLTDIARETRSTLENVTTLYVRLYPPLERAGKTTEQIKTVTKAFGQTLLLSGANAREAASAYLQFSQAMAAGKLAGDEFRTVSEANPALLMAIANGAGVARSELKKMSADGLLTTEFVTEALEKQAEFINKMSQGLPITLQQSITNLRNEFSILVDNTNKATGFTNALSSSLGTLTDFIKGVSSAVESASGLIGAMSTALGFVSDAFIPLLAGLVTYKLSVGAAAVGTGVLTGAVGALSTAFLALYSILLKNPFAALLAGIATVAVGVFSYFRGQKKAAEDAGKAQEGLSVAYDQSTKSLERQKVASEKLKKEFGALYEEQANLAKNNALTEEQARLLKTVTEQEEARIEALKKGKVGSEQLNAAIAQSAKVVANLKEEFRLLNIEAGVFSTVKLNKEALSDLNRSTEDNIAITQLATTTFKGLGKDAFEAAEKYYDLTKGIDLSTASMFEQQATQTAAIVATYKFVDALRQRRAAEDALDPKKQKKSDRDKYAEEIAALQLTLSLLEKGLSIEEAKLVSQGATIGQTKQLIELRKELSNQEDLVSLQKEIAQLAVINQLLSEGFDIEVARQIAQGNRTEYQIQELVNAQKLQEVYKSLNDELKASAANPFRDLQDLDFSTLFGDLGNPFNSLIDGFSKATEAAFEYEQTMQNVAKSIEDALARGAVSGNFEEYDKLIKDREKLEVNAAKKKQRAELQANKAILSSAKGLFKEKSTGYKVIEGMEKALFALQIANQASELAAFLVAIPTKIAGFFSVGLAASKAAIASAAIQTGPLAFVGAAAMIALMGSIGFGSGGSGGSVTPSNEGTGTVLGDKDAKSESIKKSIDTLASIAKIELPLTSAMLRSLRNIEGNIAGVGNLIVRQATVNGAVGSRAAASFGTGSNGSTADVVGGLVGIASALKTTASALLLTNIGGIAASVSAGITGALGLSGPVGIGIALVSSLIPAVGEAFNKVVEGALPVLNKLTFGLSDALIFKPLGKLFGSIFGKTKVSVTGQGLFGKDQSLGDIILGGFDLQEYADIKIKKKGLFSSSTKRRTQFSEADELIEQQFGQILSGFARSILLAAPSLNKNIDGVLESLNNFVVKIGKINLKGLKPEEIQEKLEAVFGQQADLIAQAALGGFEDFQKVGEGYFETVVRLASGVEVARTALQRLRVTAIDFTTVANTQGDVAVEIIRDSLKAFELSTNGFVTGFSQIIDLFDGSAEELVDLVMELRSMQDNIVAAGKAANTLSLFMIKGAGDVEKLQNGLSSYFDDFLTESERAAELTRRMTREFDALGLTVPTSIQGFKDLVNSIDTSTESGQELFGAVIALAPAFKELEDALAGVLPRGQLLSTRFLDLEARFLALGVTMPNTGNELEALIAKLQRTDGSVVDLSDEFGILTQANQRLSAINLDVAAKTDSLSSKFSEMGIELPKTRQEFDRLILNLRDQQGSSTSLSLAVESLSTEFNALMVSTKNQEAASQAAQLAAQQAASAGQSQATATGSLSNQVRALSSDFYNFQIALAEFGGEAGQAIQGLFEALFSSRSNVAGDIAKITGSDKLTMTPSQISAALSGINIELPDSSALTSAVSQKLGIEGRLGRLNGSDGLIARNQASQETLGNRLSNISGSAQNAEDRFTKVRGAIIGAVDDITNFNSFLAKDMYNLRFQEGVGALSNNPDLLGTRLESRDDIFKIRKTKSLKSSTKSQYRSFSNQVIGGRSGFEGLQAFEIAGGALNDELVRLDGLRKELLSQVGGAQDALNREISAGNKLIEERTQKEEQLKQVNALISQEQDRLRAALQEFALDAEKNVKRIDKLRQETVRYFEAQRQLANLMETSANKLASTLKGVRDAQLSPVELLNQMQSEFQSAYARAQIATGAELAAAADELDRLIKPLLDQASVVFASGSEADNIRQFVLGAGDDIVKRLEELKPTGYEEESIALLNQIDATLFVLEESAFQANKLLIAAIDLSRVQTVAELEQITRVLGGSPVDKSNLITPFARGGAFTNSVVNVPTVAPMAMFGEAGAEAIMPLGRSSDGSLGVRIVGGMGSNAVVERNTQETNRQLEALVRLQQAANQKMIEKLSEMEERLEGMEQAERLKASA